MHHPHTGARRWLLLGLVAWMVMGASLVPSASGATQPDDLDGWATSFPASLTPDLAAMVLPATAFPVEGMVVSQGHLLRPVDEARALATLVDLPLDALLARMRETGWIARYVGEVGPSSSAAARLAPTTGWSSIAVHADAPGALDGFALLDERAGDGVETVEARTIGDAARLTRYRGSDAAGRPFDRLRYTFVSGPLVGSVALFRGAGTDEVTAEAMVTSAERLLANVQAAGVAPGLSHLTLRLNPTATLPISGHDERYQVLDGARIPQRGDDPDDLVAKIDFEARHGVEAIYSVQSAYGEPVGDAPRPIWLVGVYRVRDAEAAASIVRDHAQLDLGVGYDALVALDTVPEVDWPVAGSAYSRVWSRGSVSEGYRITVAVGRDVAIVDVSAPSGVPREMAFALVEAQVTCLELGVCPPVPAPFATPPATPVA